MLFETIDTPQRTQSDIGDSSVRAPMSDLTDPTEPPVLIVGGGPSGMRVAQELSRRGIDSIIFNAERWRPYNRVKLSSFLAGEAQIGQVYVDAKAPGPGKIQRYDGVAVTDIDTENRQIETSTGRCFDYESLVLALGSRAVVPPIPGKDLAGVYVFRDFNDTEKLVARSNSARHVAVIGGGLLGLEAARGMSSRGAEVTVVEHETRLMPRQLDAAAGDVLKGSIKDLGIHVLTGERVEKIEGDSRVDALKLASGKELTVDTVILCTGVHANTQLADAAGLRFGRGVEVDDRMRSSDPHIFAVGECAEHEGVVQGLVGPCFEQAAVAANVISGDEDVRYLGSVPATKLKVLGAEVFSMGDFESLEQNATIKSHVWHDRENGVYRRIFVERGRLVSAIGVGDWPEASRLQRAVAERQRVGKLSLFRFWRSGTLFKEESEGVATWPREAIVCNCTGVTKGAIQDSKLHGVRTLEDVRGVTGANTVCGSCQPHVLELLDGGDTKPEAVRWYRWLIGFSAVAAFVALLTLLVPRIPTPDTFRVGDVLTALWFDTIWKQWSGWTLLGITVAAALLGVRRRVRMPKWIGDYQGWRLVHLGLGAAAILVLVWHTGFRLGANLSFVLMASFLLMLAAGAVTGYLTGSEHDLRERGLVKGPKGPKRIPYWIHILAFWPVPILTVFHVLSVYSY